MQDLDEYLYRAEQIVIWEQKANVKLIRQTLGVSAIKAMRILIALEAHGVIRESDTEGEFVVTQPRAINANDANRDMQIMLNVAVRWVRDVSVLQKGDIEKLCLLLNVDDARVVELLKTMEALGVIEETPMYRALSEEEVEERSKSWYNPYTSSVQLMDLKGKSQLIHNDEEHDPLYPQVEDYVIEQQKASTAMLQQRFQIGYARAANLMDILEERFVVTPRDGAKPRRVLKKKPKSDSNSDN